MDKIKKALKNMLKIKLTRKVKNMFIFFSIFTFIVISATYAWFISLRQVNISSFDLKIDTNLNLLLSLDGKNWDNVVFIDESNYNDPNNVYAGNTNAWSEVGLIPMSTTGEIDAKASRLKLYQKIGMSITSGGYRLLAHRVNNMQGTERLGYVTFDLFIKNFSKKSYTQEVDYLTEEAIYFGNNSFVKVTDPALANRGIENSVRIAFAQIGRVIGSTTNQEKITSLSCNADDKGKPSVIENTTGICRPAVIWEPNDRAHVPAAIYWYNSSCKSRIARDINLSSSYTGTCKQLKNGEYYPTYAITRDITENDNIDVYDGRAYNGYLGSNKYLQEVNYFTDTDKELTGLDKKEIFTLAPNSITKVRVYIFLEGQDIDNFELAQDGKRISIEFSFTKDRFSAEEIDSGDLSDFDDIWEPIITVDSLEEEIIIPRYSNFSPPKATAIDKIGETNTKDVTEDITERIVVTNNVDTSIPGEYEVIYIVSDWAGNFAKPVIIKIIVV
ncbi:MAG: DUF5011 domain-containing protein [Bacilli bacterium]|nr:DUF5011 domain-containing protein [Bacilli bacterium]